MRAAPVDAVRAARASVGLAMERCGVARIELAVDLLRGAAAEVRCAEQAVRAGATRGAGELRGEVVLLKRDIAALGRVIDAGGALHRGLALRLGCATPGYAPHGRTAPQTAPAPAYEVQG